MQDILNKLNETGIEFRQGEALTANQLNILNDTINNLVKTVNSILSYCDVNLEKNIQTKFTLNEAISEISSSRRSKNMRLSFIVDDFGNRDEYFYNGATVNDDDWNDTDNWILNTPRIIDGGEW